MNYCAAKPVFFFSNRILSSHHAISSSKNHLSLYAHSAQGHTENMPLQALGVLTLSTWRFNAKHLAF
jgi:hypothetical protein